MNAKIEALDMLNARKERLQYVYEYYKENIDINGGSYKTPRLSFLAGDVFGFSKTTLAKCLGKLVELGLLNKEGKHLATYTLPDDSGDHGYIRDEGSGTPVDSEGGTDDSTDTELASIKIESRDDTDIRIGGLAKSVNELTGRIDDIVGDVNDLREYINEQKLDAEIEETEKKRLKLVNVLDGLLYGLDSMSNHEIDYHETFVSQFGYSVNRTPIGEYAEAEKWVYNLIKGYKE